MTGLVNLIKEMVKNRLPSGTTFLLLKKVIILHKLYPKTDLIRDELHYWVIVYLFTGKITNYLGIDQKRFKRYLELCQLQLVETEFSGNVMSYFYEIVAGDKYYGKLPSEVSDIFADLGDGPYEIDKVEIQPGDVVIDAGANVGLFSLLAAKKGAQKIYAFEPQIRVQQYLKKNININKLSDIIDCIPCCLSDHVGNISFIEPCSSMGAAHVAGRGVDYLSPQDIQATYSVECVTIDDFVLNNSISKIDFIKADIEGAERDMLSGARKTIARDHPKLSICTYHLPDDPTVIANLIHEIDPTYIIVQGRCKIFAY